MILLRNDAASMAPQHVQGNPGSDESHYPGQLFSGQHDDPNRKVSTDAVISGSMSQDPNRGVVSMLPAPSVYAASAVSPALGLGFYNVDYACQNVPGVENPLQAHPYAQSNPGIVSLAQMQQGFSLQNYGDAPATELAAKAEPYPGQEAPPGVSTLAGPISHYQGNSSEDSRRLAMVHEYGNGSVAYPPQVMPHFQPGYQHSGQMLPVSVDQGPSQNPSYSWVQERELELQQMRELQAQIIWKRQLEMELQRQNPQQREPNLRQRYTHIPARMTKGKYSRQFQKSRIKKIPKLPPLTGPGGPGWCNICQADCNTAEILQQHITGKKHQKKLQQADKEGKDAAEKVTAAENSKEIITLEKNSTYIQFKSEFGLRIEKPESYLGPRKHDHINAEEPPIEPPAKKPHLSDEMGILQEPQSNQKLPLFLEICNICNVACNSQLVLDAHLKGKRHAVNAKKLGPGARSTNKNIDPKSKRSEIKEEISEKTSNFGSVEDNGNGMSNTVGDQPTQYVEDNSKGTSCTVENQPTILKDTAVLPGEPIAIVEKDNTFTEDPEPLAQEQPFGETIN